MRFTNYGALTLGLVVILPLVMAALALSSASHSVTGWFRFFHDNPDALTFSLFCGTQIITVLLFSLTQYFTFRQRAEEDAKRDAMRLEELEATKTRLRNGLYFEIRQNLATAEEYPFPPTLKGEIKKRMSEDPTYIPLVEGSFQSEFYNAVRVDLPMLPTAEIATINAFYYRVTQLNDATSTLTKPAFAKITQLSREETIDDIWQAFSQAEDACRTAERILRPAGEPAPKERPPVQAA